MQWALAPGLARWASTPAEREKWRSVLAALWSPPLSIETEDPVFGPGAILRRAWVPRPADIPGLDTQRATRLQRGLDVEERAKALIRMLRTHCHHHPDNPGRFVATHPRVARGPNARGPIRITDSPVGLVRT